jgi:hypothetical protein
VQIAHARFEETLIWKYALPWRQQLTFRPSQAEVERTAILSSRSELAPTGWLELERFVDPRGLNLPSRPVPRLFGLKLPNCCSKKARMMQE